MTAPGVERHPANPADLAWGAAMIRMGLRRKALRLAAHERDDHSLCRPETCEVAASEQTGGVS